MLIAAGPASNMDIPSRILAIPGKKEDDCVI
jgi:hypothetical protein